MGQILNYYTTPTSVNIPETRSTGSFNVSTNPIWKWKATPTANWIHTTSIGSGSGIVYYTVDANTSTASKRRASIMIENNGTPILFPPDKETILPNPIFGNAHIINQAIATIPLPPTVTSTPQVLILVPVPNSALSGNAQVNAQIVTEGNLDRVEFYIAQANVWNLVAQQSGSNKISFITASVDTTKFFNGDVTLLCMAYDILGNTSNAMVPVSIANVTPDPGNTVWFKEILRPTITGESVGLSVGSDKQGNIIAAGTFKGSVVMNGQTVTSKGGDDIFLAKYNSSGSLIWFKQIGGTSDNTVSSIAVDSSGSILMTGAFWGSINFGTGPITSSCGIFKSDSYVVKYSEAGLPLWTKQIGGRFGNNYGSSVTIDSNNDVIAIGIFYGEVDLGFGTFASVSQSVDGYMVKVAGETGKSMWAKTFGSSAYDMINCVAIDSGGDILITGYSYAGINFGSGAVTNAGSSDLLLVKYSGYDGHYIWSRQVGGTGPDSANGVSTDSYNNVFIVGSFYESITLGNIKLAALLAGGNGIYIAKYDSRGNILWAKSISYETAPGGIGVRSVSVDSKGNVSVMGNASGGVNFGNGVGTYGEANFFIAKYDPNGKYIWAKRSSNTGLSAGYCVSTDKTRNVIATGFVAGNGSFDNMVISSPNIQCKSAYLLKISP